MKEYSIQTISEQLKISKNALRYYDKIGLLCPVRGGNNYRYYTEQDVRDLQYVEVMKYAGFSLKEICSMISNKRSFSQDGMQGTSQLLAGKKLELERRICLYHMIIRLIEEAEQVMGKKADPKDSADMDQMIMKLYKELEV